MLDPFVALFPFLYLEIRGRCGDHTTIERLLESLLTLQSQASYVEHVHTATVQYTDSRSRSRAQAEAHRTPQQNH